MKSLKAGATSKSIDVFIQDSSSTTGAGLTGLVYNSGSLVAYYHRPGAASVAITLATLAAITTAWSSGGFKEVDATNMPGFYRLDVPDAAIAAGVDEVTILLKGATNMAPCPVKIILTAVDLYDSVRGGMTALPNAAAAANGGLPTVDASNSVKVQAGLKKNQALANFQFLMTDSTNHNPATGKTVSVTRMIDNGAFAAGTLSAVTEVSSGMYRVDFAAGDTNGNVITLRATATGCDDLFVTLVTEA